MKIISDSSSNVFSLPEADYACVPMKVRASDREFVDDAALDVADMQRQLKQSKGRSGSACPSVGEWLESFGDALEVFVVPLTSKISGGYRSACAAAQAFMEENPARKVFVVDTKTTGPELELIVEKLRDLSKLPLSFEQRVKEIMDYCTGSHLIFSLAKLENFARNGRVNPALAKIVSMLGIRIIGQASAEGELQDLYKCRGEDKSIETLYSCMMKLGFAGGRVRLRHTDNPEGAKKMQSLILSHFPNCDLTIGVNHGLCSYYCEPGGLLVGFDSF
ncbi:MAG: DegV family protein [Firmicutes bacterium]|nr:DegV family protein [Bacillota bacterium]